MDAWKGAGGGAGGADRHLMLGALVRFLHSLGPRSVDGVEDISLP